MQDRDENTTQFALPRETTPTWEVELLISGVAVFAMLQLPNWLDSVVLDWSPRFIDRWARLFWLVYLYAKSAALILAVTFVIHLLMRARWIALVGMHSIYPTGVDWTRLGIGPNAREIEEARMGKMSDSIERADNRATMVFALGVVLASILFLITIGVAVLLGGALWIDTHYGIPIDIGWVAWGMSLLILPYAVTMMVDRNFGAKMQPGGLGQRIVRTTLRGYARIGLGMANNPALAMLSSHHGRRRTIFMTFSIFMIAVLAASSTFLYARDPDLFGSYARFPDADEVGARSVDPANYDDRRDIVRDLPVPLHPVGGGHRTLPAARGALRARSRQQAAGGHLPERRRCRHAGLPAARASHLARRQGDPVQFDVGQDARTNRPALVAMIDIRELPLGRHEVSVAQPPTHKASGDSRIPFWR
jgi:hypothetical protein